MSLIQLENKYLFLEISPEMGASITRFLDKKQNQNIFRPFPNRKKIKSKNCYFAGYFFIQTKFLMNLVFMRKTIFTTMSK